MVTEREKKDLFLVACARGLMEDVRNPLSLLLVSDDPDGLQLANDLIAAGVQPNAVDADKRGGAHFAAARGELEVLQLLHSKGVDIDAEDALGRAPLHYAAFHNHESIISFLATKSAWLDACDGTDCSALHLTARGGAAAAATRLVRLGAKPKLRNQWDLTALGEALCRGRTAVYNALEREGCLLADDVVARVNGGFTLLHVAAAAGQHQSVEWFLRVAFTSGCSTIVNDSSNPEQLSPLHCSVLTGQLSSPILDMLVKAGADVSSRDVHGRTSLSILEAADATPELRNTVANLARANLQRVQMLLTPKSSFLQRALFRIDAITSNEEPVPIATPNIADAGSATYADETLTVAARLQACMCPDHVAAVLQSVPLSDQVHRVKLWAKLTSAEIHELSGVSRLGKQCLEQVKEVTVANNRAHAVGCLRRDERFQEAMRVPSVRKIVDAVIQDPHKGPLVRDQDALACLNKLRGLRDVLSLYGGGQISLPDILRPWDTQDKQREAGMSAALESKIEATVAALCHAKDDDDKELDDMRLAREQLAAHRRAVPEIQPASPRERKDSGANGGWDSSVDCVLDQSPSTVQPQPAFWHTTLQKIIQQVVVAAIVLAVFWTQGKLPYQLDRPEHKANKSSV